MAAHSPRAAQEAVLPVEVAQEAPVPWWRGWWPWSATTGA